VKPAVFTYQAPRAVEDVLEGLYQHGSDARVLAGGQSLVRLMNARIETPGIVIDINRIPGLDEIAVDDGTIRIGALVRQRASEMSPLIRDHVRVFSEAGAEVAHVSVRERGTVIGSIAFADPCAELPTALLALDGELVARSTQGERTIAAADFFLGPYDTAVAHEEMLVEARLPVLSSDRTGSAFVEVTRRHGELPVCGVATVVRLDEDQRFVEVRISVGAVGDRPIRVSAAESAIIGRSSSDAEALREAAELAARGIEPRPTVHGSAAYRRHLAAVVTRRSLARALARAQEGAVRA
jgi:carbon-monoxide dehydrogenase medium subunit